MNNTGHHSGEPPRWWDLVWAGWLPFSGETVRRLLEWIFKKEV
jgi:hypothetical protein